MMSRRTTLSFLSLAGALWTSACAQAAEGSTWSYAETRQWATLSADYAVCSSGHNQSPVNIVAPLEADFPIPVLDYPVVGNSVLHDGHTLKVEFPTGNTLAVADRSYRLRQLHFHVPAEHRIEGRTFPMEAHLVHEAEDGRLAVLAVLFELGEPSQAVTALLAQAPGAQGERVALSDGVDARSLLGDDLDVYRLNGSLTTPPCSEGVLWWVAKRPRSIGESQLEEMSRRIGEANNRPLQPLNARRLLD
ncbi:carbonic anhydrase [Halomonas sp. THAF12]|uniref:carbonic anhydrase n=1 Tax=Halomonas sp. B23F22_10 TaxID=3459515 RepID=UPI00373FA3FD